MLSDGKRAFQLLRGCWKTLQLIEILYRLFTNYILFPIEKWLFNFCLQLTNIYYVSVENILRFLSNPLMILCCII